MDIKYPMVFIDETGTGKGESHFGIGFLKLYDSYNVSSALLKPHTRAKSMLASKRKELKRELQESKRDIKPSDLNLMMSSTKHNEFHFTEIQPKNLDNYLALLDVIKDIKFHFCALIVDKNSSDFNPDMYKNPWDYYVRLLRMLCEHNLDENDKATLITDYITKPKISTKDLDKELISTGKVTNVLPVDSVGVSLIQLCDIFLGSVAFVNKWNAGFVKESNNSAARKTFVKELCKTINIDSPKDFLTNNTFKNDGKYFSVWHLKMQ